MAEEPRISLGTQAAPVAGPVQRHVRRFDHGSRVPGWDQAADLTKDPSEVPEPATTFVPGELRAEIEGHMAKYPDRRSAVLPALAAAQRLHGWLTAQALEQVAAVMQLTPGYLVSVASFYDMLDTVPTGRHRVYVCTNISCSLNGADALLERIEAQVGGDDDDFNVRHFECLGACDMAPMAAIDGVYVGPIELDEVPELIEQVRAGEPPLPAKQLANRRSTDPEANTRDWPLADRRQDLATAGEVMPRREPAHDAFGGHMDGDPTRDTHGPAAPIEQTGTGEGTPQTSDGAT